MMTVLDAHEMWAFACEHIRGQHFSEEDLERAKVMALQANQPYLNPQDRGFRNFVTNVGHDVEVEIRKRIIHATQDDLIDVCNDYLTPNKERLTGTMMIGPEEKNPFQQAEKK
jgi:Zn-dependent M16 (insulinase) family peptidase